MNDPNSERASDGNRDPAVERLRIAAAKGQLTAEERAARTDAVRDATTSGQLAEDTTDLPARPAGRPQAQPTGRRWIVSVLGDITHSGSWPTRHHMSRSPCSAT